VAHELTDQELVTYSRQIALDSIGYEGQAALRQASACLIGLGGLGSLIAQKLTAMGLGRLRLVDRDVVSRSDLHRQVIYNVDQVGMAKVEAAQINLGRLNPDVQLEPMAEALTQANTERLVTGFDIVLDGLDRPAPRYALNRACHKLGIPWIFGAAVSTYGNLSTILPGQTMCLECLMPGLKDEDLPKCAVVGVHPSILGVITSLQVAESVALLTGGEPQLSGRLLFVDLQSMDFHKIEVAQDEECPVCGAGEKSPPELEEESFEETCSRDGGRSFFFTPAQSLDLDLAGLAKRLKQEGHAISQLGRLALTFAADDGVSVSLTASGGMIVQYPPASDEDAGAKIKKLCRWVLVDLAGVPDQALPGLTP
jgi:molybdopterin/thiamine biosynthesis adenylyltransferase